MAFEGLSEKLNAAFKRLRGKGRLTENDVREAMREVRLALLEADVSYKVVKEFVATVTERSVGTDVLDSLTPAQQVVKIVNEELTNLMGGGTAKLAFANNGPTIVMMVGLQGAGKTTTTAKLAGYMKKFHSKRPLLAACDVYRPAAIEQLKVVGGQLGLPVFEEGQGDPVKIAENALRYARDHGNDLVFLDTAGRLHVDEALMDELKRMKAAVHPNEILLVVDAMTGQDAVNAASAFDEALGIDGVVLTKLDGDARGGAALSIKAATGKPIKFVGTGEKLDMIEPFHPDRMASRILGMGDMLSFIEKAQQTYDEKQAKKLEEKLKKNSFTLSDYFDQLQQIRNMGDLSQLAGMMPGNLGNKLQGAQIDEKAIAHTEAIILSMTPEERENPQILGASRKKRIAAGCGLDVVDVNRLLKQFEGMQQIIKQVTGGRKPGFGFGGLGHGRGLRGVEAALEVGHDRGGVALDAGEEVGQRPLSPLDVRQGELPLRGELGGLERVAHDVDQRLAALGGRERLASAADVLSLDQLLDHAGAGGRRPQAAGVHRVVLDGRLQLAVLDGSPGVLHGRQKRSVGVGLRRGRLAVLHAPVALAHGERVALLDVGGDGLRLVLVVGGLAAVGQRGTARLVHGDPGRVRDGAARGRVGVAADLGLDLGLELRRGVHGGGHEAAADEDGHGALCAIELGHLLGAEQRRGQDRAVAVDLRVVGHAGDVGARRVEPGRGGLADDSRHRDGREHAGRLGDVGLEIGRAHV